jgi:DivIVA domain-containing protein
MTEDIFQLTPHDVRAQEFQRAMRGYDRHQVDEFKMRISEEFERLIREKAQLEERIRNFQEQLRAFRDRERAMNDALVAAQQLRVEAKEQADAQAESIIREAKTEALGVLSRAQKDEQLVRERIEGLNRQFAAFLSNFRALLERQLGEVEGYEAHAKVSAQVQTELVLKRQA